MNHCWKTFFLPTNACIKNYSSFKMNMRSDLLPFAITNFSKAAVAVCLRYAGNLRFSTNGFKTLKLWSVVKHHHLTPQLSQYGRLIPLKVGFSRHTLPDTIFLAKMKN